MAASSSTPNLKGRELLESWAKSVPPEKLPPAIRALFPEYNVRDPERESRVMHRMRATLEILACSKFYRAFVDQMRSQELSDFSKVLGSEEKMTMVIYGIGSIETYESPRSQLALALLMRKDFPWIGDIEVYDPVISEVESKVMTDLGCTVLTVNERCCREVVKPTLFFMPHCVTDLYRNLLHANWDFDRRSKIALLGNAFSSLLDCGWLFGAARFTREIPIDVSDADHNVAFGNLSWHFFGLE